MKNLIEAICTNNKWYDIMVEDVGAYKIWDCGLKKWAFKN